MMLINRYGIPFLIGLIVGVVLVLLIQALPAQPQDCPNFEIGDTAYLYAGDVFDGRPVEVFQPGWYADGTPMYVVKTLTDPLAYLGATGCELHKER